VVATVPDPDPEQHVTEPRPGRPPPDPDADPDPDAASSGPPAGAADPDPGRALAYPVPSDDLDGYRTATMRVLGRFRLALGLIIAAAMLVPAGGWVLDRLALRAASDAVLEALGDDADLAASLRLVRSVDCFGRASSGSAFALETAGGTVLVTNRHVVAQARSTVVQPLDASSGEAVTGVRLSAIADVAVLEVANGAVPPPLGVGAAGTVGQPVISVGFPGARPTFREGRIDRVEPTRMVLGLEVAGGASGSPVLDQDGAVVGQVYARTSDGRGLATPVALVEAAIAEATPASPCG
jgi:S1-C subfamily serine protease